MTVRLRPGRIIGTYLAVVAMCLVLSVVGRLIHRAEGRSFGLLAFDVDAEGTVPAWVASLALLACAGLLAVGAAQARLRNGDHRHWTVLAAGFAVMALDEAAGLHDRTISPLRDAFDPTGALFFAWVVPAGALVAVLGIAFVPFVGRLPVDLRTHAVLGAVLFVGGALGVEVATGVYLDAEGFDEVPFDDLGYLALSTTEEALEFAGAGVFLRGLLRHLAAPPTEAVIRVSAETAG